MKTARHYRGGYQLAELTELARELRAQRTPAENLLWQLLRNRQLQGFKFRRQYMLSQGLRVLRFGNDQILNDTENVLREIAEYLVPSDQKPAT